MAQTVKRAYKYRFYPTTEQAELLNRTFGCVRVVWNRALAERTRRYKDEGKNTAYVDTAKWLTAWKQEEDFSFLREVSNVPLQQALRAQQVAFSNFFAQRAEYPRFKSRKKSRKSATFQNNAFTFREGRLLRVARIHARIADRRRDYLHKVTTRLVRENQALAIEDLTVGNMLQNHSLARAISDAAWSQLRSMLEYKCQWYERDLLLVDRWFPSSKLCSTTGCSHMNEKMPLNVRSWTCQSCGTTHDRDVNAANNILAAGLADR